MTAGMGENRKDAVTSSSEAEEAAAPLSPTLPGFPSDAVAAETSIPSNPSALLFQLETKHPELLSIPVPKEIQEVAEEIVSGIDGPGIERWLLTHLLQVVLYLDRPNDKERQMTAGQIVYCVICIGSEKDDQVVHIFSTTEKANAFCASDNRVHVAYDYVIDCPERMDQATN